MRMHADQVDVTVADARGLLPPELADPNPYMTASAQYAIRAVLGR